jgi:hypothetical protein
MRGLSLIKIPASGGGGGGTNPGGSDTFVQYNKAGAFGGDADFVWDYGTQALTITGTQTVTGALSALATLSVAKTAVIGNSTTNISGGFDNDTYINIEPTYNITSGLLNFVGVLVDATFNVSGGTSVINGFAFRPTVTGSPSALNAFTNTIGSNLFNTLGGQTIIGPTGAIGASIFQVFGNSMFSGAMTVGGSSVAAPTASIQIVKPGTAAANDGQLKLSIDTALKTTPETGLFEFDGTNLHFTIGGVRKTFTLT